MPSLLPMREGEPLSVKGEPLEFSYWPTVHRLRRYALHNTLFTSDPWIVIESSFQESNESVRSICQAYTRQARDYFKAARDATSIEAKPLLYYYSFLNLAKSLISFRNKSPFVGSIKHGIADPNDWTKQVSTAQINIHTHTAANTNAFDALLQTLGHHSYTTLTTIDIAHVMPAILYGHRMWCTAQKATRKERFVSIEEIEVLHDNTTKSVWPVLRVAKDKLSRLDRGFKETLEESGLLPEFRLVGDEGNDEYVQFELTAPIIYRHRPVDILHAMAKTLSSKLWRSIESASPYRRYYLYLKPAGEPVITQVAAAYSLMFYLGSVARYRPMTFVEDLNGPYGSFIREYITTQPSQLLYTLACEFKQQEITSRAVV